VDPGRCWDLAPRDLLLGAPRRLRERDLGAIHSLLLLVAAVSHGLPAWPWPFGLSSSWLAGVRHGARIALLLVDLFFGQLAHGGVLCSWGWCAGPGVHPLTAVCTSESLPPRPRRFPLFSPFCENYHGALRAKAISLPRSRR